MVIWAETRMFPSAGYFRSAPCPFHLHGLCHRPYCHFKHAKPVKEKIVPGTSKTYAVQDEPVNCTISKSIKDEAPTPESTKQDPEFTYTDTQVDTERKEEIKPILTDITELLRIPGDTCSESEATEISSVTSSSTIVTEKKKAKKDATKDAAKKKKASMKMTDLDFFSSVTPKTNAKKRTKASSEKGVKRKASESRGESSESEQSEKMMSPTKNATKKRNTLSGTSKDGIAPLITTDDETPPTIKSKPSSSKKIPFEGTDTIPQSNLKRTPSGVVDYIPESCIETVGHGSVKKRIAHKDDAEYTQKQVFTAQLPRSFPKKPSYVSPVISGITDKSSDSASSSIQSQVPAVTPKSEEKTPAYSSEEGLFLGKRRTAHSHNFYKKDTTKSSLKRPKIPIEYGAKVPQNIRQRYLDKLIDEYLPKCYEEQEALDKGVEEEAVIYQRSTRRQIYMNLCVNAIKRIRDLPTAEFVSSPTGTNDPLVTAGTTISNLPKQGLPGTTTKTSTGKVAIRPSAPSLAMVNKKHSSLLEAKAPKLVNRRQSKDPPPLTEDVFFEHLLGYLATENDLWENNYPRAIAGEPGIANLKKKQREPTATATKRICIRCGKQFFMDEEGEYVTKDECHYHWGKIRRIRGRGEISMNFSCCQGDPGSLGCCACKLHVSDFIQTPIGYVNTDDSKLPLDRKEVFSLDCEMCYTSRGLELTRVSVVNFHLKEVYDTFVKPDRQIIDYNTRFSGVTEVHLRHVKVTLKDVQNDLLKMFSKNTILMGHSLESDLKALKIIHSKVVDTALVFPHKMGLPYKRALRNLMADHLKKIIQDSEGGHDSSEDSSACMELMRWKVMEDIQKKARIKHY